VITKGVGFLPLLVLIPYGLLRPPQWTPRFTGKVSAKWLLGPLAFVLATAVWLVPMLLAATGDPTIAAYRDEILFRQTVDRYANAWHHREPFWYFIVQVIPWLWLPLTALLPWLVPKWRDALRARDLRIALLLAWVVLVVVFFSMSTGKRGVYVLPAVPAFALACAPYLRDIAARFTAQRFVFWIAATIATVTALGVPYLLIRADQRAEVLATYDLDPLAPLITIAVLTLLVCVVARPRRGFAAFAGLVTVVLLVVSFWINPELNEARSGRAFVERVERTARADAPLGFVAFKEQYLLNARRPVVHFGHARWREGEQETMDAARWLAESRDGQLVVSATSVELCFKNATRESLGQANRIEWFLVRGMVEPSCVTRGAANLALYYDPTTGVHAMMSDRTGDRS